MEIIPIHTRTLTPPKDDLFEVMDTSITDIQEGDVILVTSKVVSIHEGRCVPMQGTDKDTLIENEAQYVYQNPVTHKKITITRNTFISASGIDESNGMEHYIVLPEDAFQSAKNIHAYLTQKFAIKNLGVIITDSHSMPLRYGSLSVSIGSWGFEPVEFHQGKKDLFGRSIKYAKSNVVDALAASSALVSGECNEGIPIAIARGVPNLTFTVESPKEKIWVTPEQDLFGVLLNIFTKKH